MRVLHAAQTTAGGIASYFEEIADYQAKAFGQGNVMFVVPDGAAHLPRIEPGQLIRYGSASRTPSALLQFARATSAAIERFQPDIVHVHSSYAGAIVRAMLSFRPNRPRVIYCPHGWAFGMETSQSKQRAYAFVERRLASVTDLIHVVSKSEFDLAAGFGLPAEKMRILANGIGWTSPVEKMPKSGPLRLAFIGRHDRQKGLDILLDAIRRHDLGDIHFDVVGAGILGEGVQSHVSTDPNITYHGWLSRPETLDLLAHVDAVIMPSRWDAAPIVAIEAMRAGLPVIGSNRGAIPEIVEPGVGGYIFDLDDSDSLVALLRSLDRPGLERLGVTARRRWETHYASERMNDLTRMAYEEVIDGTRKGAESTANAGLGAGQAKP